MSIVLDESGSPIYAGHAAEFIIRLRTENNRLKAENKLYAAEMSAAKENGFYSAQELFMAYQNAEEELAEAKKTAENLSLYKAWAEQYWLQIFDDLEEMQKDAERLRWLTEDHPDKETRIKRCEILTRIAVLSHSAACMAIDAAMKGK